MPARARVLFVLVVIAAAAAPLHAQAPTPDGILDGVVQDYGAAASQWLDRILPFAQRTFALLATLELAISGLFWALGREGLDAIAAALLKKFIVIAFLFSLLTAFPLWLPFITRSFDVAGQTAAGVTAANPSRILDLGISIASHIVLSVGDVGLLVHPTGVILGSVTAVLVLLAYAFIAAQLCLTLIEVYLVLSGGVLFLSFAGCRITAPFAEGYLLYAFRIGAKVYLLYLLVAVVSPKGGPGKTTVAVVIGDALSSRLPNQRIGAIDFNPGGGVPASLAPQFAVMTGTLVLALLVARAGAIASQLISASGFHLREALR